MYGLPSHPRYPLLAGAVAALAALMLMLLAAPELAAIDVSILGGDSATRVEPLPPSPDVTAPAEPRWVADPLASPLETLAGRR